MDDAVANAKRNVIDNVRFFVGKAEEVLPAFYNGEYDNVSAGDNGDGSLCHLRTPDVIVVDPPRKGCDGLCLDTMLKMQPARIVYVSCDPATLARDLKILTDGGYELTRVRPCDMFPHCNHIETVALIERVRNAKDYVQIGIDAEDYYRIKDSEKKTE